MIGSRGFRMVEPPRASTRSARIPRLLAAENREPITGETAQPMRAATPRRSRSPPQLPGAKRQPAPDTALGQRRRPPAQANQSPPESTTERSQL